MSSISYSKAVTGDGQTPVNAKRREEGKTWEKTREHYEYFPILTGQNASSKKIIFGCKARKSSPAFFLKRKYSLILHHHHSFFQHLVHI